MPESTSTGGSRFNPFSRRDEHSRQTVLTYKILSIITYIMLVVTALYYEFRRPHEGHKPRHRIWQGQPATPFAQNQIITSLYWLTLFIIQLPFIYSLFNSSNTTASTAAYNVGSHYIFNNLLLFGFLHLWTRSHYWPALLLIVVNFFNLSAAYFRHSTAPRMMHIGTVSGPLAWNFVALYWVGAVAVGAHSLPARIVANVFIWGFLVYGIFFLVAFKDYTMGFALSILSFSTAVGQMLTHLPALQWIFAFTIGGLLFVLSTLVALPGLVGRDELFARGQVVNEDRERAPLLADE